MYKVLLIFNCQYISVIQFAFLFLKNVYCLNEFYYFVTTVGRLSQEQRKTVLYCADVVEEQIEFIEVCSDIKLRGISMLV